MKVNRDNKLSLLLESIRASSKTIVMTGAGISVESGIPTFQGTEGLWSRFGKPNMDAFQDFKKFPEKWWEREINHQRSPYVKELRKAIEVAKPNTGHIFLTKLLNHCYISSIITQNIDGLHLDSGATEVIEIHGNRHKLRCLNCCYRVIFLPPLIKPPANCPKCHGIVKYDSVMFGEPIPEDVLKDAKEKFQNSELVIVIGSSSTVRPAAGLSWIAKSNGAKLVEINPNKTKLSEECEIVFRESASTLLPDLWGKISSN